MFKQFPDGTLESLGLTKANLQIWARVNESTTKISDEYEPKGVISKYDLFWAEPAPLFQCTLDQWYYEFLGAWKNHVNEPVREHKVTGNHFSILQADHIGCFQEALNNALASRGL